MQMVKVYQKGILGKNYIMLHMLIQQEWKGRSITTCMNVRVGLTEWKPSLKNFMLIIIIKIMVEYVFQNLCR